MAVTILFFVMATILAVNAGVLNAVYIRPVQQLNSGIIPPC